MFIKCDNMFVLTNYLRFSYVKFREKVLFTLIDLIDRLGTTNRSPNKRPKGIQSNKNALTLLTINLI